MMAPVIQDENPTVRAAMQLVDGEDFLTLARNLAQQLGPYLRDAPTEEHIAALNALERGFPRVCLAVLFLEVTKVLRQSVLEVSTLFILQNLNTEHPQTTANLEKFAASLYIYSPEFAAKWTPPGAPIPTEITALLSRHRAEFLKMAHDVLSDYLSLVRETSRRVAMLFDSVVDSFDENDRHNALSKEEVRAQSPDFVATVDGVARSVGTVVGKSFARAEKLRRYLQMQALTEAEALGVTVEEDAALFELRFSKMLVRGDTKAAWDLLQRYRSTVLLSQVIHRQGERLETKEILDLVRCWAARLQAGPGAHPASGLFEERLKLDALLWHAGVGGIPGLDPLSFDEVRAALRAANPIGGHHEAALVEYVASRDATYALITKPSWLEPRAVRIELTSDAIMVRVRALILGNSQFRPGRFEAPWCTVPGDDLAELRGLAPLVACIPEALGDCSHLCVVPYGIMHHIPFQALPLPTGEYLVERYSTSYLPCASMLSLFPARGRRVEARGLIAGAVYAHEDPAALAGHLSTVHDCIDASSSVCLQGLEARPDVICGAAGEGQDWDLVYLHGHGAFVSSDPLASYILFSDGTTLPVAGETHSKFRLTAADVFASQMSGDMAVLAACVSGRIEIRPGDELLGWVRAFLLRGFHTVVTALWSFETEPGRRLLEHMIRNWLQDGRPRAEALAEAQREFLRGQLNESWKHPYYWAAFFMVGGWE